MRLSHNLSSLSIYNEYSKAIEKQQASVGRLSSGAKVSAAKDDPNVIAQSERFRMQVRGMQMASANSQDGMSMLQTNEGALDSVTSMLQRVRELTVKAGNDTNSDDDKATIKNEINQMIEGIDDIVNNTEFNGVKLINGGTPNKITMPVGSNIGESIDIPRTDMTTNTILSGIKNIDFTGTNGDANIQTTLSATDNAIKTVLDTRQRYGAIENRFEDSINILNENSDKTEAADSSIRDVDYATEMAEYSKQGILIQAGNAMMVQANKFPQDVLQILGNVRAV